MPPAPDDLNELGDRIEDAARKRADKAASAPPGLLAIGFRFSTEMVAALLVGGAIGWGIDWAFDHWSHWQTRPWGIVIMTVLGAAAGMRNVLAAAKEMNAKLAKKDLEN